MQKLLNKLAALVDVKSLVTLGLMITFVILSLTNRINQEQFMQIFLVIITYYFAKTQDKGKEEPQS